MSEPSSTVAYQLKLVLRGISPMICRRLLVHGDSTIADLHYTLQIAFGWSDTHLHRFRIHARDYGIAYAGRLSFPDDPHQVRLTDLAFRPRERFLYEYDFHDGWHHDLRVEHIVLLDATRVYPICLGGKRAGPPEECGGPLAFMEQRQRYSIDWVAEHLAVIVDEETDEDTRAASRAELAVAQPWLRREHFDRRMVNQRLRHYAAGDAGWRDDVPL